MSPALPVKLQGMLAELQGIEELTEKYEVLIEMGQELPDIPQAMKTPEHMVQGCQSLVHIYGELDSAGKLRFHGYADAKIVNGLLALLVLGLSGLSPEEFLEVSPDFIKSTGVSQTLTPSRINGFYNIFEKMKLEALRFLGKNEAAKRFPAN
jgi:cysteine desulfuration protein SufE